MRRGARQGRRGHEGRQGREGRKKREGRDALTPCVGRDAAMPRRARPPHAALLPALLLLALAGETCLLGVATLRLDSCSQRTRLATGCAANPDAKRLYDDLLSNYNKLVRPVLNVSDALTVRIKLKLSQLIDVVSAATVFPPCASSILY